MSLAQKDDDDEQKGEEVKVGSQQKDQVKGSQQDDG